MGAPQFEGKLAIPEQIWKVRNYTNNHSQNSQLRIILIFDNRVSTPPDTRFPKAGTVFGASK